MNKKIVLLVSFVMVLQFGAVGSSGVSTDKVKNVDSERLESVSETQTKYPPQEDWNKTFDDNSELGFNSIDKTKDGNIILMGDVRPEGDGGANQKTWLVKVDKDGNILWNKKHDIEGYGYEDTWDVIQTSDGGYAVTGILTPDGTGKTVSFILKTDGNGNKLWDKTYGSDEVRARGISESSNGYVVSGFIKDEGWIMKTDENGNVVWNNTYGGDFFNDIVKTSNGYIASGAERNSNAWLTKVDENGNIVWNKSINGDTSTYISYTEKAGNGKYAFIGSKGSNDWFGVFDDSGNIQWSNSISGSITLRSITSTSNGYLIAGGEQKTGNRNALLLAIDKNGNERWNTSFGGGEDDDGKGVVKYGENYYLAGGTNSYKEGQGPDGWLIKASPEEPPTADFSYSPSEVDAKEEITFDASGSSDPDNDITSYDWNIAGNSATGKTTNYTFPQNGTYTVELTVTDSTGNSDTETKQIQVSAPNKSPSAKFNYSPKKPDPNQTVRFNASMSSDSDGSIASYNWEFNRSGFQISGKSVQYSFNQKGMHKVTLTVTDDDGATDKKSMTVNVTDADVNSAPQAKFKYSPKNPNVTDSIKFNASMSSDPNGDSLSYEWDFGDGDNSTGKTTTHKYSSSGEYTVELTVKDGNGASDKMKMTVNLTSSSSKMSVEEAIANLKTQNNIVNFSELQSAINFWIQNREVPGTGGKKIDFSKLQDLISLWVQEKVV